MNVRSNELLSGMRIAFQQNLKTYTSLQAYAESDGKRKIPLPILWQALEEYFEAVYPMMQGAHFAFVYAVDLPGEQICYHRKVEEYLGYRAEEINLGWLVEVLHPKERRYIGMLTSRMRDFVKSHQVQPFSLQFSITHQIRKADGSYIKVLRQVSPFLVDASSNLLVYFCLCIDVSSHNMSGKVTFDVSVPENVGYQKAQVLHYFADLLTEKPIEFTPRELEAIKVWSETDSARTAAERLGITVRTLETHLKNARRKLNVRRSLDLVIYAKENKMI